MSIRSVVNVRKQIKKILKKGNKFYKKKDFFKALEMYQQVINKYELSQDFSDLVKEFENRENRTLIQLDEKLQGILNKFLEGSL